MDRTLVTERRRVAQQVDVELCVAARAEAAARRELGTVAHVLLRRRAYRRLGFVRLSDYARERLGVSARTLQAAAWVATRLDRLPAIGAAFDRSDLSWTQARALCAVASAADESHWLELASRHSVDALERFVRAVRPTNGAAADHDADPDTESNEHLVDGEPALRLRFSCPARIRGLWRWAVELASRAAGEPLSEWRAAEIIAAEGFSGRPDGAVMGERALAACIRLSRRAGRSASEIPVPGRADGPQSTPFAADSAPALRGDCDPFALDARLVDTMRVIRTSEPRIGHLLGVVVSHRFYRTLGFSSLESYVRERLGISIRKAWALLKLEKVTRRGPAFARAYSAGELSWARALALLPVLHHENAEAWVRRAQLITVRRLCDEVNAVLQARDMLGTGVSLDPPPLDAPLTSLATFTKHEHPYGEASPPLSVQIGARRGDHDVAAVVDSDERAASELCDAEVRFTAPASVIALFRDVLDAFARPGAPRWTALEALLRHVIRHWESTSRHRDPIFARDGWRCAVPACSSRRNLHDHHLQFRSRGGTNARWNRSSVCVAHHLHGLHTGAIRASGTAPHAIHWQLGVRAGAPPLLAYIGDRYLGDRPCVPASAADLMAII